MKHKSSCSINAFASLLLITGSSLLMLSELRSVGVNDITIGDSLATAPATYHFSNNYNLIGNLIVDGPVIIVADADFNIGNHDVTITPTGSLELYVEGDIQMNATAAFNNTNKPITLQIYGSTTILIF